MTNLSPELIIKAKNAQSAEELLALAKENDVEMTEESAAAYFAQLNPTIGELSDDELDNVSGGCGKKKPKPITYYNRYQNGTPVKAGQFACGMYIAGGCRKVLSGTIRFDNNNAMSSPWKVTCSCCNKTYSGTGDPAKSGFDPR